jgi:type II secretory pathway pseudopilin PulG
MLADNKKTFTLVEVLVSITIIVISAVIFFSTLNRKESFYGRILTEIDLQAEARSILNLIAQDMHQTSAEEAANNSPSPTYIKFRQVTGVDTTSGNYIFSPNYITYTYNSNDKKLSRIETDNGGSVIGTREFGSNSEDILVKTFAFSTVNEGTDTVVPLNQSDLSLSKKLIAAITVEKEMSGTTTKVEKSLTSQISVRND